MTEQKYTDTYGRRRNTSCRHFNDFITMILCEAMLAECTLSVKSEIERSATRLVGGRTVLLIELLPYLHMGSNMNKACEPLSRSCL